MKTVGIFDAKSHLSELIESGEVVTITKHGRPVATLSPIRREPSEIVARIRGSRCIDATADQVVALIRESRR
jgi:prevent-host-death family protein